jgi:hypothetical protein
VSGYSGETTADAGLNSTCWRIEFHDRNVGPIRRRPDLGRSIVVGKGHFDAGEAVFHCRRKAFQKWRIPIYKMKVRTEPDHAGAASSTRQPGMLAKVSA